MIGVGRTAGRWGWGGVAKPPLSSWPKHDKAATLHVISLAHFALTQKMHRNT